MSKVFIETYGCSANIADSEIMLGLLKQNGFSITSSPHESDLNIINTCIVKRPTVNRMIYRIKELTKLNKPLIVAGCMPKTEQKIIEKINSTASLIGPDSIEKIIDISYKTLNREKTIFLKDLRKPKLCLPRIRRNPTIGIIEIATGCLSNCSYCSVKFARGKLHSYPINSILEEAKQAINNGCKELYITSQDNSCYGKDTNTNLAELLNAICKIEGKFLVRVGMMNPLHVKLILNDLIHVFHNEKIFNFLHLPVQSGSNNILKLMKRGYEVKEFLNIVESFRKELPMITLSTDVIVGFPYENDAGFKETVKLLKKVRPDIVNISKFGFGPGTDAAKMRQIAKETVNERTKYLHNLVRKISLENNKKWLNWEGETIVDEEVRNGVVARNFAYKPIIIEEKIKLGSFVNVKIVDVAPNFLVGKLQ